MSSLSELLAAARRVVMTPAQKLAQAISFAYGNTKLANPAVTYEGVREAARKLVGEGDGCPDCLKGTLTVLPGIDCYCHVAPPCGNCVRTSLRCDHCGWYPEER